MGELLHLVYSKEGLGRLRPPGAVPRGAGASPVKFLPPPSAPPPQKKKFKIRPSLAKIFRKLALHFNVFMFCDIQ